MNDAILRWHDIAGAPAPGTVLAAFDAIPEGGACLIALEGFKVILLRSGDAVFAYVNRCAHLGLPLAEKIEHLGVKPHLSIRCSVHYARFRWQDGFCEFGDCEGEWLLPIPVTVADGQVRITAAPLCPAVVD